MNILPLPVINHQPAIRIPGAQGTALTLQRLHRCLRADRAEISRDDQIVILRRSAQFPKMRFDRLHRRRRHGRAHVPHICDPRIHDRSDRGPADPDLARSPAQDHAARACDGPLGRGRTLAAVAQRKAILPLRGRIVRRGHCRRRFKKTAGYAHGRQQQPLRHGGAGPVQAQRREAGVPQAIRRADALIQKIPGKNRPQRLPRQVRTIQRGLQRKLLHFRLRLFPGGLSKTSVALTEVKVLCQRSLAFLFPGGAAEAEHDRRRPEQHRMIRHVFPRFSFFLLRMHDNTENMPARKNRLTFRHPSSMLRKRMFGEMTMPFEIIQNDITRMHADAIVNTANPEPVIGSGTDYAVHTAAGPELLEARRQVGAIRPGCCAVTPGYGLDAKFVIHAVGPKWRGGMAGESRQLRNCYDRALALAADLGCSSIAFPLISTGIYGFPKDRALKIAVAAFRDFLKTREMQIWLVVWDRDSVRISEKLHNSVAKYVDAHYVAQHTAEEYAAPSVPSEAPYDGVMNSSDGFSGREDSDFHAMPSAREDRPYAPKNDVLPQASIRPSAPETAAYARRRPQRPAAAHSFHKPYPAAPSYAAAAGEPSLSDLVRQTDAGFSETVLRLIDESGKKDAEIYRRANLTRQHFSKIRSNPNYRPTKPTALALAIALELDLEQTKDLLERAGYALSNSSKSDVIVSYFISRGRYDLFEINAALFEFDQLTLGAS